jgi:DNA repair protein RecO (recombination protein O)
MNLVDIIAYEREGKDMTRLKEVRPAHVYTRIPFDVYRGTVGLFMLEVTRNSIKEAEENPALFSFLYEAFRLLDTTEGPITHFHLHFLLELTAHLGMLPAGNWSEATPLFDLKEGSFTKDHPGHPEYLDEEQAALMFTLLHARHNELGGITSTRQQRNQLLVELIRYYRYHVEGMREINSLKVLREVMG